MNGQWFPGWGFMRFWESDKQSHSHNVAGSSQRDGILGESDNDQLFRCTVPSSVYYDHGTVLGASPAEIREARAKC